MRHKYVQLVAWCYDRRMFGVDQMREAVEYLKTQQVTDHTGLGAVSYYRSPQHRFQLKAEPLLPLDQVLGKTPAEVWDLFDNDVDRQITGLEHRCMPGGKP